MEIIIPSLKEKNTLSFIKNLSDIETSNENEIVFCFDAEWVKPLGMALCCSAVKQFSFKNEERGTSFDGIRSNGHPAAIIRCLI